MGGIEKNERKVEVKSPCIRNCCLDMSNLCMGCYRTLEEICEWNMADNDRRQEIKADAKVRRKENKSN
jgi:uncharacterized protein